jgi:predicted alpha-1,2-mannosidase
MRAKLYSLHRPLLLAAFAALSIGAGNPSPGAAPQPPVDALALVDPYIGVDWYGQAFLGATVPFGMVKVGPDMESHDGRPSKFGYLSGGRIMGFSHLHLSGAAGKYGNIRVMPATGTLDFLALASPANEEVATPAYFAATLTRPQVRAEMTSSGRAALHRYTFRSADPAHLTVRLDQIFTQNKGREGQLFLGANLNVVSPREVSGVGRYAGGWNMGAEYRVYFAMITDQDADTVRTWSKDGFSSASALTVGADEPVGATFDYGGKAGRVVNARIGISFVSVAQARRNATQDEDFVSARAKAEAAWRKALSPIVVEGGRESDRRQFYTGLYHVMLMPSDRTGENPKWRSDEPYYDDYHAIWDTFRSAWPLLTMIHPDRSRDMLRSLIDIYRHEGWMPDGRAGNSNGRTQGGSNADVVVADAYVKGMKGIDYRTALAAMIKNATVTPPDPEKEGRGGLPDYLAKGYISTDYPRAGSRTVEYAYDDFAIAQVACGLGKKEVARRYVRQSGNFANLWDRDLEIMGIKGFLRPRKPDGSWATPYLAKRGTWPDFFYEADVWTYSVYAPHDMNGLIALAGGRDAFMQRLDRAFDALLFDMTNEPGFLMPMLYHWLGRPDKSASRIIDYRSKGFLDERGGTPGPEDSGAMSSWLVFQSMGFFPVAGQDLYLIGTPRFTRSIMDLGNGARFTVEAPGAGDPANRYVQSAKLNGTPIDRAWFRHSEIANGGSLVLQMGPEPTHWGQKELPPSLSTDAHLRCE